MENFIVIIVLVKEQKWILIKVSESVIRNNLDMVSKYLQTKYLFINITLKNLADVFLSNDRSSLYQLMRPVSIMYFLM